jgi:antitoxin (DNA-binding transcriptional repressor) of toxin-antitoxin stability system
MSTLRYINTQEIRRDLLGFLQELAKGERYVVLNRSKPVVTLKADIETDPADGSRRRVGSFLEAAALARAAAKGNFDPCKPTKELYYESMAEKYGIPGHQHPARNDTAGQA